jgi:spore germination protein KC
MKIYKRILLVFLIIGNMFINTSCWNYKDVERLGVVMSFAIDKDAKNNQYILTVEIAQPEPGQNQAKYMSEIYESTGSTIFEAVRELIKRVGKKTYWAHASIGILSKAVVSEDITHVIDFFYRDAEPRADINILVSKRETAKEILQTAHNPEELRTTKLQYIMENQESISKYPETQLKDLVEVIASKEKAILIPMVDMKQVDDKIMPEINGSAVLKYDRVTGYLTGDETQFALWVMGELKGGLLVVQNIAETNDNISFEILRNKTKVKSDYNNEELRIKVDVNTTVDIGEVSGGINFQDETEKNKIREDAEKFLKDRLEYIVKKMQNEYKSDIFDFGNKVGIENRKLWKNLKPKWDEEFTSVPVDINIDLIIKGSSMTSKPLKG